MSRRQGACYRGRNGPARDHFYCSRPDAGLTHPSEDLNDLAHALEFEQVLCVGRGIVLVRRDESVLLKAIGKCRPSARFTMRSGSIPGPS